MLIKTLPVGHLETNCYVVTDEDTLECAVIDPGAESNTILGYLEDNKLKCVAVMLTHAHFDHVGALKEVLSETGAKCYVNKKEERKGIIGGVGGFKAPEGAIFYGEGDEVHVGSLTFRVMETPGHTAGGVTLICEDALFTGDTLFRGSIGTTMFGGSDAEMHETLEALYRYPGDYGIYPGHGESTSLSDEKRDNPFFEPFRGV